MYDALRARLTSPEGQSEIQKIRELTALAEKGTAIVASQ